MRTDVFICDECGKMQREDEAVNWLELSPLGITRRAVCVPPTEGHFCTRDCVIAFVQKSKEKQ